MLDEVELMQAFTAQMRTRLRNDAEFIRRIRLEAEAMWKENPPEGYSTFEAWWRHRWVCGPFGRIQRHLEEAAALTFRLEARYRASRHEIPEARRQAQAAKEVPALIQGEGQGHQPWEGEAAPQGFMDALFRIGNGKR